MPSSVLLVSSSGGVLLDLMALEPWWSRYDVSWWAADAPDTREVLSGSDVHWSLDRRATDVLGLLKDAIVAWRRLRRVRPSVVVSAGSRIAIPVFVVARLLRVPCLWVETLNVIARPGISARLCARLSEVVVVQHQHLLAQHRRAVFVGELY